MDRSIKLDKGKLRHGEKQMMGILHVKQSQENQSVFERGGGGIGERCWPRSPMNQSWLCRVLPSGSPLPLFQSSLKRGRASKVQPYLEHKQEEREVGPGRSLSVDWASRAASRRVDPSK